MNTAGPKANTPLGIPGDHRELLIWALLCLAASLPTALFFDHALALWIAQGLKSHGVYETATDVPDQLPQLAAALTGLCWLAYGAWRQHPARWPLAQTARLVGTALPLAFAIKVPLKWAVGRTETLAWLSGMPDAVHWFAGGRDTAGFPSGHMLVLTPLFLAGWYAFPKRHRWVFAALGVGLALALMGSAHHFLSDVLAGAGAGALVYAGTRCALTSGELVTG